VGLAIYPEDGFQCIDVEMGLGQQFLELAVLALSSLSRLADDASMHGHWLATRPD
jgi:hypothetical protein